MRNLLYLKIATIVTFLLIVFPGKLSVFNGITIFIGLCVSILEVFYITDDFMFILKQLLVSIVIILSIGLLLNKKKFKLNLYNNSIFIHPFFIKNEILNLLVLYVTNVSLCNFEFNGIVCCFCKKVSRKRI